MDQSVYIVGIGGPSGSGKSTIAEKVAEELDSPFHPVNFDTYFLPDKWPEEEIGDTGVVKPNAELPTGVDFASALRDIHAVKAAAENGEGIPDVEQAFGTSAFGGPRWRSRSYRHTTTLEHRPVVIVLEGYLVFYPAEIAALCDCCIWLDLDMHTSLERRYARDGRKFEENGISRDGKLCSSLPTGNNLGPTGRRAILKKTRLSSHLIVLDGIPTTAGFVTWYTHMVWKYYEIHKPQQLDNAGPAVLRMDASLSLTELVATALKHTKRVLLNARL